MKSLMVLLGIVSLLSFGCSKHQSRNAENPVLKSKVADVSKQEHAYNNSVSVVNDTPYRLAVFFDGQPMSICICLNGPKTGEMVVRTFGPGEAKEFGLGSPSQKYLNNTNEFEQAEISVKAYSDESLVKLVGTAKKVFYKKPRKDYHLYLEKWVVGTADIKPVTSGK